MDVAGIASDHEMFDLFDGGDGRLRAESASCLTDASIAVVSIDYDVNPVLPRVAYNDSADVGYLHGEFSGNLGISGEAQPSKLAHLRADQPGAHSSNFSPFSETDMTAMSVTMSVTHR